MSPPEPRWPGALAVVLAAGVNWLLPESHSSNWAWLAVLLVIALAAAALLLPKWHDILGHATAGVVTVILAHALYALVMQLLFGQPSGRQVLRAAFVVWSMNVIVFASWYWRLDAGGPHHRSRRDVECGSAFIFPQMTLDTDLRRQIYPHGWRPSFIDYLFLAFNTSTAFSPTDAPVLSRWAKVLMMMQSSISLTTLAVVAGRAVNILDTH
ncbi:MAG: hypothetical protein U0Q16_18490 [Bryobacteraceae bacterium]